MYIIEEYYRRVLKKEPPYYAKYSLLTIIWKPIRKGLNTTIIPNIPFNFIRIILYKLLGFKIGQNVFIGMKCYLDDIDIKMITIEDDVTISYGCYFACHGKDQVHTPIHIKKGAYLGLRTTIISGKRGVTIGENAIIGAMALVNKDIPDNATAVGVPIKIIKTKEEKTNVNKI